MLAVVQWASRAGGSPRLPTRRTPPFFCASAGRALRATGTSDATATTSHTARRCGFIDMVHLPIVGEPMYHTSAGASPARPGLAPCRTFESWGEGMDALRRLFGCGDRSRPVIPLDGGGLDVRLLRHCDDTTVLKRNAVHALLEAIAQREPHHELGRPRGGSEQGPEAEDVDQKLADGHRLRSRGAAGGAAGHPPPGAAERPLRARP